MWMVSAPVFSPPLHLSNTNVMLSWNLWWSTLDLANELDVFKVVLACLHHTNITIKTGLIFSLCCTPLLFKFLYGGKKKNQKKNQCFSRGTGIDFAILSGYFNNELLSSPYAYKNLVCHLLEIPVCLQQCT